MKIFVIFLFIPTIKFICGQCIISLSNSGEFSESQPLILKPNFEDFVHAFYYPENSRGDIRFSLNQEILLACPGKYNKFRANSIENQEAIVTCSSNNLFQIGSTIYPFSELNCIRPVESTAKPTGTKCWGNNLEVVIGFELLNNRFIKLILLCHDDNIMSTLYTYFTMTSAIGGFQRRFPRPFFVEGIFFNKTTNINLLYQRNVEQRTFVAQLKSDREYISSKFFINRGHLAAKADFVYGVQQCCTFYYVNSAPQWESFNSGNWNDLELSVRNYSANRVCDLEIYTGTFGICSLPNNLGVSTPLYLLTNHINGIPIPRYFWKVVYRKETKEGLALIGVNNPYQCEEPDVFCKDICDKITWLQWNRKRIDVGYGFCCEVDEFRRTVQYLPQFSTNRILN